MSRDAPLGCHGLLRHGRSGGHCGRARCLAGAVSGNEAFLLVFVDYGKQLVVVAGICSMYGIHEWHYNDFFFQVKCLAILIQGNGIVMGEIRLNIHSRTALCYLFLLSTKYS